MNESLKKLYSNDIVNLSQLAEGHSGVLECCHLCINSQCLDEPQEVNQYRFIATGITATDVIQQLPINEISNTENWHTAPVMFLAPEPSRTLRMFDGEPASGPKFLPFDAALQKGLSDSFWSDFHYKLIEEVFAAAVRLFQLKNACLTYVRKCHFPSIKLVCSNEDLRNKESRETTNMCTSTYLLKELQLLQPKAIFCVETAAHYGIFLKLGLLNVEASFETVMLPHPSYIRLMKFRQPAYKHALFGLMAECLVKAKVIEESFVNDCFRKIIR
ncbi:MAG: hypothetical protein IT252_15430 [Chitinophagaceae bacterium]|nr:hypothetical protein [Chitinophagaceae bacterium]